MDMFQLQSVSVVLPTFNPGPKLPEVVTTLMHHGFTDVIVVDDGSAAQSQPYIQALKGIPGCTLLVHPHNRGKGAALKTAFAHFLEHCQAQAGVVTVDDDLQHQVSDVVACTEKMLETNSLILGSRNFLKENVPFRSRFGNVLTSAVFRFGIGMRIKDTQTGLRAIPAHYLKTYIQTKGERFEYETNMLIDTKLNHLPYMEVDIATVYVNGNAGSHFNPVVDSIKIFAQFGKYLVVALASFALDVALFYVFKKLLPPGGASIFYATGGARVLSAVFNFTFNRRMVFASSGGLLKDGCKYLLLCLPLLVLSGALVSLATVIMGEAQSPGAVTGVKIVIDTFLFMASYWIQKHWVFKSVIMEDKDAKQYENTF